MYSFVARQAIIDQRQHLLAYELLFRKGLTNSFPNVSSEEATTCLIGEQFLSSPLLQSLDDKLFFINFPYQLIINGLAETLPLDRVVIEILEDAAPDDLLFAAVKRLKTIGFRLALDDFSMTEAWDRFLPYIDIIKFDFQASPHEKIQEYIQQNAHRQIQFLAEKIETNEEFQIASSMGCNLFQGYFFSKPEMIKQKALSSSQLIIIQLMKEVNNSELDYEAIEDLLNQDLSLAYKLLRYVNNIKYRATEPISSFKYATMYLGQNDMRRFVAIVSATSGGSNKCQELYKISLIRARFCELLSHQRMGQTDPAEAFMCGLFSLLDVIMDQSLTTLLPLISLPERIGLALLHGEGELASYLAVIRDYETQHWEALKARLQTLSISEAQAIDLFAGSAHWCDQVFAD